MYRELKSPFAVQLELTTRCNHRCVHCYNYWRQDQVEDQTLSEPELEKIITNLKENKVASFLVTGGEPMLYPDLMFSALELAQESGLKASLNSNLTLTTPAIAARLRTLNVGVLTSILSFDRSTHDRITTSPGSFDRLVRGLRCLQQHEVSVAGNMVVMQENLDHIYETGRFVHGLGVTGFSATKVHPAQGSTAFEGQRLSPGDIAGLFDALIRLKEDFGLIVDSLTTYPICLLGDMERYGEFLLKRGCSAGRTGCTIGADGKVRPCGHSDDTYGNSIEESLGDIWPRLKEWRDGSLLPNECRECDYVVRCSGGCRMDCKFYGRVDGMDPYAVGSTFDYIPPKPEEIARVTEDAHLTVNPSLALREEEFGSVLLLEGEVLSIVTPDSARLLKELKGTSFTPRKVASRYEMDLNYVCAFFSTLCRQQALVEELGGTFAGSRFVC